MDKVTQYEDLRIPEFEHKDAMNRPRTISLFMETNQTNLPSPFTTKDEDHTLHGVSYRSLRQIYIEIADITEYEFAQAVFGSWKHWLKISNSPILEPYVQRWRDELEVKLSSQVLKSVIQTALEGGSTGVTAAKYIVEKGWEKKADKGVKKKRTKKVHAKINDEIADDAKNIGLH